MGLRRPLGDRQGSAARDRHTHTLLIRRALITLAGLRWNIEDDNRAGKDLLGLDHYQVRKWTRGTGT